MNRLKRIISVLLTVFVLVSIMAAALPHSYAATKSLKLSENGIKFIKNYEGCYLTAQKALSTEEYYTIGWGHYGPDVKKGQKITQEEADALFLTDIADYEKPVNDFAKKFNRTFTQNQFDALVSFTYNMGEGWTANSNYSLYKYMSTGTYTADDLSDTFTSWCHSGGAVIQGLYNRRESEVALFLTSDSTPYEVWEVNTELNHRSNYSTSSTSYGTISAYTRIIVTEKKTANGYVWGKTRYYNGTKSNVGWCALKSSTSSTAYASYQFGTLTPAPTTKAPTTKAPTTKATTTTTSPTTEPTETPIYSFTVPEPPTEPNVNSTAEETTTEPTTITTTAPLPTVIIHPFDEFEHMGDCNGDGQVNAKDVLLLRKYMAKYDIKPISASDYSSLLAPNSFIIFSFADVNSDGSITASDLLMVRKFIAKIPVSFSKVIG